MSELVATAAVIAPFVSAAAASMAHALVDSAQTRLADGAVERGRQLLDRALHRGDDQLTGRDSDAVRAIEALSRDERELLEGAIGRWLGDGTDLSARALERQISEAGPAAKRFHVATYGNNSPAIGEAAEVTFTFNTAPDPGSAGK
ncbi:hypothetical protein AW27_030945 [Streptomyces sp. PCS3-D2]|uniref:hypothetical protein n=1 Tax=Streptomyces sp. PCS3-D2 TaxID=1460244 RepID=UPI0004511A5A|nr:hypothetical protein [Streptomyces sp. PCS3-D2]WKV75554.1 hypothetical protein AW27_030945 [Streptomyces sp. PCS3-D2]